jgi:hypothetical protein
VAYLEPRGSARFCCQELPIPPNIICRENLLQRLHHHQSLLL